MKRRLIKKKKTNEEEDFEVVFRKYFTKLVYFAMEYVADFETAREITQETMVTLWDKRHELNLKKDLSGYLYTLVKNRALNHLKHQLAIKKYQNYAQHRYLDYLLNQTALNNFSFNYIEYKQLSKAIQEAVDSLPEKCKNVFIMSRYDGFSHREIAEKMNISVKTIENHIAVAIKKIKRHIFEFIS